MRIAVRTRRERGKGEQLQEVQEEQKKKQWKEPKEGGSVGVTSRERGGEEEKVHEVGIAIATNECKEEKEDNCKRIERSRERSKMTEQNDRKKRGKRNKL